jgi:predicted nucleic acid-binding protein
MSSAVLDTNILIGMDAGHIDRHALIQKFPDLAISRITYCEYLVGYTDLVKRQRLGQILEDSFEIIEINQDIAWRAVDLRLRYRLNLPDAIIYATARSLDIPLLTRNIKDFDAGLPGVHIPYIIEE